MVERDPLGPDSEQDWAAGQEVARAAQRPGRRRNGDDAVGGIGDGAGKPRREADEAQREGRRRLGIDRGRRIQLLDPAAMHHCDPVRHRQRLVLVMRDEDRGGADLAQQALEVDLHGLAQLAVERREGLVEQQKLRPDDERTRHGDTLLLAA